MGLSSEQISSRLFKKSLGIGETLTGLRFFEEPKLGKSVILPTQIWNEADLIPQTAPTLVNNGEEGVVKYFDLLELQHIPGSQGKSYFAPELIDTIPFNFGDGSYGYNIRKNNGVDLIPFGQNDWLLDTSAGVLTFYNGIPSGVSDSNPPKVSFYKYIGDKGLSPQGASNSTPYYQFNNPDQTYENGPTATNISLDETPVSDAVIEIFINGQKQKLGESTTNSFIWFGTTTTAKSIQNLTQNDVLIWDANTAGFVLEPSDEIEIIYKVLVV